MTERKKTTYAERRLKQTSLALHEGDKELIKWGAEFLGTSSSDFIRTAIRAYAMSLQQIDKRLR